MMRSRFSLAAPINPIWAAGLFFFLTASAGAQESVSLHLTLGNPSQAVAHPAARNNYLVIHEEYCASFNVSSGCCNWVSWHLCADDIGGADRGGLDFVRDDLLPEAFPKVTLQLYNGAGFDKGHGCPSKDRSKRAKSQRGTFRSTNLLAQAPKLNRGPWGQHEDHRRQLAGQGKELYIIVGPAGRGGLGAKSFRQSLGRIEPRWMVANASDNGFDVPAWCWSACVILDEKEGNDLDRVTKKTATLAVIMPNTQTISGKWQDFQETIHDIEELTGLDLFDLVEGDVQDAIEHAPVVKFPQALESRR
ncbi:MAG: DNA/RNA non-specific endonuclease [Patescibacteria group bacterium]|nr:DNA/RNA non-specific endonuclease [Patescibacteria group bacterium]